MFEIIRHSQPVFQPKLLRGKDGERELAAKAYNAFKLHLLTQRVLSTHMEYTYPNRKGNYYYRNHTLYHVGTLDPLGLFNIPQAGSTFYITSRP